MDTHTYAFLCVICLPLIVQHAKGIDEEVCASETFHANCSEMSVIFISSARYGRMRIGRCMRVSFGYEPCFIDVLTYVDKLCGGRKACNIRIPDAQLDMMPSPCHKDFKMHLEISYHCQEGKNAASANFLVYHASEQVCIVNSSLPVVTPVGYLANIITDKTNQGSSMCPWKIQLQPGETVNLTLLDFATHRNATTFETDTKSSCIVYAKVKNSAMKYNEPERLFCGTNLRERLLLTTEAKEVHISIEKLNSPGREPIYFLIKYDVFMNLEGNDTLHENANVTATTYGMTENATATTYSVTLVVVVAISAGLVGLLAGICITMTILLIKFRNKATTRSHDEQMMLRTGHLGRLESEVSAGTSVGLSQATEDNYSDLNALHYGQTDVYTAIASEEAATTSAVDNPPTSHMPHYDYVIEPIGQSNSENGYLGIIG